MDYAIEWAESALEDLKDLVRYIAADNPVAAERFGKAIIRRVEVLAAFPRTGRIVPELGDDLFAIPGVARWSLALDPGKPRTVVVRSSSGNRE